MRDLKFYPAIVFSDCDSSCHWIRGESSAVQQIVAPAVVQFTAGLVVTVVKWMEGQPQDDGLIGLQPLLPLQKRNVWKTKIIITQAVLCSGLKRKVAAAPYLKETKGIKASSSLWWSVSTGFLWLWSSSLQKKKFRCSAFAFAKHLCCSQQRQPYQERTDIRGRP